MGVILTIFAFFLVTLTQAVAAGPGKPEEDMIRTTMYKANISAVSAVTIKGGEEFFYTLGEGTVDETSLFCIGSLSKSFTGFAVLYLEKQGQLSLRDPLTKYIPWFEAEFQGKNEADAISVGDLLYQTSGFTNEEKKYPNGGEGMGLEDTVKNLSGRELSFSPSERFAYANANYNLLGYIIEQVAGRPYADFMEEEIFRPLGLTNTFATPGDKTGVLVQGTRLAFGQSWKYTLPISQGAVPSGYILSCSRDLSRWLQIHLDSSGIPQEYVGVAEKARTGVSQVDSHTRYGGGWYVDDLDGRVYHSGGTPNYSSRLVLDRERGNAAAVLTNINASANTDDMADNLILLMSGDGELIYRRDIWTVMDTVFSMTMIICFCLIILTALITAINRKKLKKTNKYGYILAAVSIIFALTCLFLLPAIFGSSWSIMMVWGPPTMAFGIASLILLGLWLFFITGMRRKRTGGEGIS